MKSMLQNDPDRMAMVSGGSRGAGLSDAMGEPVPETMQRINAIINDEVKFAKEYGDEYFNSGVGLFGRLERSLGDSGKGQRAFDAIKKEVNNDKNVNYSDIEIRDMLNKGYIDADLPYRFELPKKGTGLSGAMRDSKAEGGSLKNPEKADLDKDGTISDYEQARGEAIEESMEEREKFVLGAIAGKLSQAVSRIITPKKFKNDKIIIEIDNEIEQLQNRIKNHDYKGEKEAFADELTNDELAELSPEFDKDQLKIILSQKQFLIKEAVKENKTPSQIFKEYNSPEPEIFPKRTEMQEGGMMDEQMKMLMEEQQVPDEEMEEDYLDFIINEALNPEEEDFLVEQLKDNDKLSEIFDKVIEVASEFTGAGPVEGPGTGVSDSIPARLSDGEFVFTAKATEQIGVDKLMSMMKEAEAAADERREMQEGGVLSETTTTTRRFADPTQMADEEEVMQDEKTIQDMRGTNPRMQ